MDAERQFGASKLVPERGEARVRKHLVAGRPKDHHCGGPKIDHLLQSCDGLTGLPKRYQAGPLESLGIDPTLAAHKSIIGPKHGSFETRIRCHPRIQR